MQGMLPGYEKCFFCGPAAGGLALELQYVDGSAFCNFTAHQGFQGYDGMLHGGIVSGILDEVMWWTLFMDTKMMFATWKIEVEFRRPIECGSTYHASAQFQRSSHGTYYVSGLIEDGAKNVCAKSTGAFRQMKGFTMGDFIKYLNFRGVPTEMRGLFQVPEG